MAVRTRDKYLNHGFYWLMWGHMTGHRGEGAPGGRDVGELAMTLLSFAFHGPRRSGQRSFYGPAELRHSVVQRIPSDAERFGPVRQAHRLSVMCQHAIRSLIARLLCRCRPTTIFLFVVAVIVNSFNAVLSGWANSHIGKEVFKRHPAFAHCNSTPTIPGVVAITMIAASFTHSCPRIPFRRPRHSVAGTCALSALGASTTSKIGSDNWLLRSAFAAAEPFDRPAIIVRMKLKNRPFPKCLASQVYKAGMSFGRIVFSHVPTPLVSRNVVRAARRSNPSGCSHYSTSVLQESI